MLSWRRWPSNHPERQSGQWRPSATYSVSTRNARLAARFPPSIAARQQGDVNIRWFRLLHSRGALFGGGILRRSLYIEYRAALGQQGGKLTVLGSGQFRDGQKSHRKREQTTICAVPGCSWPSRFSTAHPTPADAAARATCGKAGATDRLKNNGVSAADSRQTEWLSKSGCFA